MAVYEYTARGEGEKKFSGMYNDIDSVAELREELAKAGYVLIKAQLWKNPAKKHRRIKSSELIAFSYKFAGMYSAGLPILSCLDSLEDQTENLDLKYIITDIKRNIEGGSTLRDALEEYKYIFSEFFLGMIEAGEAGGKLATALEMSSTYLEKQEEIKRKVKSAFAYPIVVTIMCFVVVFFLLAYVIPVFSKMYEQVHVELPGPTLALVVLSSLVRNWWWAIFLLVVGAVTIIRRLLKNPTYRAKWDVFKLNMPIFGKLNRMVVVSHFIRTFAMMISVGISIIKALDVASGVAHNSKMTEIAEELQEATKVGNPFASSLKKHKIFPPMIKQLAVSGEEAGELPEMLNKSVDFLDKDIDRAISALLVKLEPALTVIMGAIVAFLLMGAYLPMFDYIGHLK